MQELICEHVGQKKKRYLLLTSASYRVGKALDNDIVLLDSKVPPVLATLHRRNQSYIWTESNVDVNLNDQSHNSFGYRFRIRDYRRPAHIALFSFTVLFILFVLQWFTNHRFGDTRIELPARGTYGNLDLKHPVKEIEFSFQANVNKYSVLHFTSGNLETDGDLEIAVNEKSLAFAPASPKRWNIETTLLVPAETLESNQNVLRFRFRQDSNQAWGVKDIYIETMDEKPVGQNDADQIETAKKLFHERSLRKGNLVRSLLILKQINQTNSSISAELLKTVEGEKQKMIESHWMVAQKFVRQGYPNKAKKIFETLLDELIDPVDPDRTQIEREIQKLDRGG